MTSVRSHLAVASAVLALAVPFITIANASGTVGRDERSSMTVVGRQSRTSGVGIAGGSVYLWSSHSNDHHGGACTVGFAVRRTRTSRTGVVTAGHCVRTLSGGPAYVIHQTRNLPPNGTDPGVLLARVARGDSRMGSNGDSAFGRTTSHSEVRPYVFIGGTHSTTTIPVVGLAKVTYGMHVCYSGAASGEHCGFTVGRRQSVKFHDHNKLITITHEYGASRANRSCTSVKGDSGSPVYLRSHNVAYAVGILSGGQQTAGQCPFFFTPIRLALQQLHLTLLRAKP